MKYKLLVLDVDGTLLNEEHTVSKRTMAALRKAQQLGVRIVLASGRPVHGLMPVARLLELGLYGGFVMAYNGAVVVDAASGATVFERRVDPAMLPYLEKKARKNGFAMLTYHGNRLLTDNAADPHVQAEAALNGMEVEEVGELAAAVDFSPHKCVLVSDDEEALCGLEAHWKKRLAGVLDVFRSEPFFLEVVPCTVEKANTLGVLLEQLNLKRDEVMAIGDGPADVAMLQLAGMGVAMGHSPEQVKICADRTTAPTADDGVAQAVEQLILADVHPSQVPLDRLNSQAAHSLMGNLGIQYTYLSEDRVEATMPVDHRTRQPFGILHGGATLALAETVAGLGSMALCQSDEFVVGMQVSGNHVSSALEGDTVRAVGTVVHKGRSSHVWNVDVFTSTGKLVSTVRVVNSVMKKR